MSIEASRELNLEAIPDSDWPAALADLGNQPPPLVIVTCRPASIERAGRVLLDLRAHGSAGLLMIDGRDSLLDDNELAVLFGCLRDWDQCLLRNILEVCLEWIPQGYHAQLTQEARTELKWLQEWQTATADPRLHKYPTLPWRSFIRRINQENFAFASLLLELVAAPSLPETRAALDQLLTAFLDDKKKAVCLFPKHKARPEKEGNA
jgi:hypothetical protein